MNNYRIGNPKSHWILPTDVGNLNRYFCDVVQNLERSNLRSDGSLLQEGRSAFDKDIGQFLDFSLRTAAYILQGTLP